MCVRITLQQDSLPYLQCFRRRFVLFSLHFNSCGLSLSVCLAPRSQPYTLLVGFIGLACLVFVVVRIEIQED